MYPASSRPKRPRVAIALMVALMAILSAPSVAVTASGLEIDLRTSDDVVVKNSDLDLTVMVKDATTGEPVSGCDVVLHIEKKASDGGDGNGDHMHGDPLAVPDGVPVPSVDIEVTPDPKAGWNLRVMTTNFRFAPENASTDHVWGEGHAHLYIDDVKIGRLYGEWYHIGPMEAGTHTVRVTLNTNDHQDLARNGVMVMDTADFESDGDTSHGHIMMMYPVPDGTPVPVVALLVHTDPKAGWNLQVSTTSFEWAPQNASTTPVMGEGHAHIYVDGEKLGRLYGEWFYLGSLSDGDHQVRVTLNANNHSDYARNGQVIEDIETINVPPGTGDGDGHGGAMTINATPTGKAGEYRSSHKFTDAGDYIIEVHVTGDGYEEAAVTFNVEVMAGDPAALTVTMIIFYIVLAVILLAVVQVMYTRYKVKKLQDL